MITKNQLDDLYRKYNKKKYVHPDPLEFLYNYSNIRDREIAGLIASSLAYGRVAQILKSVERVLNKMGPSPYLFLKKATPRSLMLTFKGFKHRFTTDKSLVSLLTQTKKALSKYGSLNKCFIKEYSKTDDSVLPA
ncbi:DUF2400 family protein, partial [Verrucomicrobiota bacterium]